MNFWADSTDLDPTAAIAWEMSLTPRVEGSTQRSCDDQQPRPMLGNPSIALTWENSVAMPPVEMIPQRRMVRVMVML
jgi:hypothetical protein